MPNPVKNIDRAFEKMMLLWDWGNKKKARKKAQKVLIWFHNGGRAPEGYDADYAYWLAECVFFGRFPSHD